jgi:two-component sensor histidine kinase
MGSFLEVGSGEATGGSGFEAARTAARHALAGTSSFTPSLTLVFASGDLDAQEVAAGVADVVGDCPTAGSSTNGEIFGSSVSRGSVVVTVLASPYLRAEVGVGEGVRDDWRQAVQQALPQGNGAAYFRDAPKLGRPYYLSHPLSGLSPLFVILFAPGIDSDNPPRSHEIHSFLKKRTLGRVPIVGGGSGAPDLTKLTFQLANGRAHRDAVVMATVESELLFGIGVSHGFRPTRRRAVVTRAEGHIVHELDDRAAAEVCAELLEIDSREFVRLVGDPIWLSCIPFGTADAYGHHHLLTPEKVLAGGAIQFAPNMDTVEAVTLMAPDRERQVASGEEALARAMEIGHVNDPAAILLFDCFTRSVLDEDSLALEEEGLRRICDAAPTTGFLSFGEYGLTDEGLPIYCNESMVALVIGNELELSAVATRRRVNALQEVEAQLVQKSRELNAIRRANEIVLDRGGWRRALSEFESILAELTGAESVSIEALPPEPSTAVGAQLSLPTAAPGSVPAPVETEGAVLLPLVSLGQALGHARFVTRRELASGEVAASICQLLSRGLHQAFLERTIEEQAREIDTVQSVAQEILTASDYRAALVNISQEIARHLGASGYCLWIGEDENVLSCLVGSDPGLADKSWEPACRAVDSRAIERSGAAGGAFWASPLILHERLNGVLALEFCRGQSAPSNKLTFLGYLSMPVALMVEIFTRHRESNVAREIHHRVKNNLQIIASLLNLQLRRIEDPFAREPLQNSIRRIMSIAVVHEALCEKHVGPVEAVGLIRSIADLVVESMSAPSQRLSVTVEGVPDLTLTSQQATNLAIVVNELMGNALKHGLEGQAQGSIEVRLERSNGHLVLSVADDGRGLAPWFDLSRSRGLGLQLILNIARTEFTGSFAIEPREGRGVEARLAFPMEAIGAARIG